MVSKNLRIVEEKQSVNHKHGSHFSELTKFPDFSGIFCIFELKT